ncbi:MAG: hypothetical protein Q8R02_17045 [Hyphomonadaceae bacterium]|nr:hypothetical protein [Hyphomonadaceae bacterium]
MTQRAKLLRKRITTLKDQLAEAEKRGESESYLALCRFKIDELKTALACEEAVTPTKKAGQ